MDPQLVCSAQRWADDVCVTWTLSLNIHPGRSRPVIDGSNEPFCFMCLLVEITSPNQTERHHERDADLIAITSSPCCDSNNCRATQHHFHITCSQTPYDMEIAEIGSCPQLLKEIRFYSRTFFASQPLSLSVSLSLRSSLFWNGGTPVSCPRAHPLAQFNVVMKGGLSFLSWPNRPG